MKELSQWMIENVTEVFVDRGSYDMFSEALAGTPVRVIVGELLPPGSAVFVAPSIEMPGHDKAIAGFRAHLEKILKEKP